MDEWRQKYNEHLNSEKWRDLKRTIMKRRGHKCERCGSTSYLELHHKTYERLGHERASDLELLCPLCHEVADAERAQRSGAVAWQEEKRLSDLLTELFDRIDEIVELHGKTADLGMSRKLLR